MSKAKSFRELKAVWDKKLAKSGFVDSEQPNGMLKAWHGSYWKRRFSPLTFESQQKYFELAERFLVEYTFEKARDRKIWAMHASGMYFGEIKKKTKLSNDTIAKTLKKLRLEMFILYVDNN